MGNSIRRMIEELGRNVAALAGSKVKDKVMEGSQALGAQPHSGQRALWIKGAIERLDKLADKKTRFAIMEKCGVNCARFNSEVVTRAMSRRKKFSTLEAFLEAEVKKPLKGTKLERHGRLLKLSYLPQSFSKTMRCFCALVQDLPEREEISPTYCHCSKAFVRTWWEAVLSEPVKVDILETALTGSHQCQFRITMGKG
ncbi:MAG: hypothetical protein WCB96_00750 [Candidatus Aminicenantales bacterium]